MLLLTPGISFTNIFTSTNRKKITQQLCYGSPGTNNIFLLFEIYACQKETESDSLKMVEVSDYGYHLPKVTSFLVTSCLYTSTRYTVNDTYVGVDWCRYIKEKVNYVLVEPTYFVEDSTKCKI